MLKTFFEKLYCIIPISCEEVNFELGKSKRSLLVTPKTSEDSGNYSGNDYTSLPK